MSEETESFKRHKASTEHLNLGSLIVGEQENDAVHIAVAPMTSDVLLRPGQHVGVDENGKAVTDTDELIGIVDPFLRRAVVPGQPFWLCLYPGSINSLRHKWTHPKFNPR